MMLTVVCLPYPVKISQEAAIENNFSFAKNGSQYIIIKSSFSNILLTIILAIAISRSRQPPHHEVVGSLNIHWICSSEAISYIF